MSSASSARRSIWSAISGFRMSPGRPRPRTTRRGRTPTAPHSRSAVTSTACPRSTGCSFTRGSLRCHPYREVVMYDLLLKNGTVIDGTGAPRRRADIAIANGAIVEIGDVAGPATRTIDAGGLIGSPGFLDPHTHYDAQICWDPLLSCSSWHGVTTVIMGHCGVGLAPCKPDDRQQVAMDLVTIESIPFEALRKGVGWEWTTFAESLAAAERRGLGINAGFVCALTPLRRWVLGQDATERAATPEETRQIAAL